MIILSGIKNWDSVKIYDLNFIICETSRFQSQLSAENHQTKQSIL